MELIKVYREEYIMIRHRSHYEQRRETLKGSVERLRNK